MRPTPTPSGASAARLDVTEHRHGQRIPDPYRWLEDAGDPRTVTWIAAQDDLFAAERERWHGGERWHALLTRLTATSVVSPPAMRGARTFFTRRAAGAEHPALMVAEDGTARVLVDPLAWDPAGGTVLDSWRPSAEGDLLVCQLSSAGTEDSLLWVLDVASGRVVDGPIDRVRQSPIGWLPGGEMFYYVRRLAPHLHPGDERYHRRVYLHRIGSGADSDVEVFGRGREKTQFYSAAVTADGRWLTITATSGADPATEIWLADLADGSPGRPRLRPVRQLQPGRTRLHVASGTGPADPVWLSTRRNAPRGRVVAAGPADTGEEAWRELIPERRDAVLADLAVLGGQELDRRVGLARWTRRAASLITVHDLADGRELGVVELPGTGTVGSMIVRPEGGHEAWLWYTDYGTPPLVLHYDARSGTTTRWGEDEGQAPGPGVTTTQLMAQSADGTWVPVFVIAAARRPDRPRPVILTGYGGFGVSMSPSYLPEALAWVSAGGVFAVACLRGGGEQGEEWHHAGRGHNKQNVFDDFDAVTGYLVESGWTTPDKLAIMGNSNGGLLVGAALTQHPEKYAAAVCMAPLLDMARYERSGLGPSWVPEYGSADDPAQLATLLSYSPYHHVRQGASYPPVLFTVSDGDTRVDPMHARKMCAALQHASSGTGPVLLRNERGAGHGARAVSRDVALQADCLAFLAAAVGLAPPGSER